MAAVTIQTETNANLQATSREAWRDSIQSEVFMKHPILARLLMANRITWNGGGRILVPVDFAEGDSMVQYYSPTDPLDAESKTYLTLAQFDWKSMQIPVMYGLKERLNNKGASKQFDLRTILVDKAHRGLRIALSNMIYGADSGSTRATDGGLTAKDYDDTVAASGYTAGDEDTMFQAATHCLTPDAKYGQITRTAESNIADYWQPGSISGAHTDWDGGATLSPDWLRQLIDVTIEFSGKYTPKDYLIVMGPSLFRKLRTYVEAHRIDTSGGMLAKFGFDSIMWDGYEIVKDFRLQHKHLNGVGADNTLSSEKWVFMFCIPTWEMRFHAERKLRFTGFKWQGDRAGGRDEWLARIMASGNFFCTQPKLNAWYSNIT